MISSRLIIIALCFCIIGFVDSKAFAEGYEVETPDAAAMGQGYAFIGQADSPAAVYYNPAGINQMSRAEVSMEDAILAPRGQYTSTTGDTVQMENNEYNIPSFFAVAPVIPDKLSIGVGSGSYWGLGTNWGPNSPLQYASTQANLTDVDNMLVASYQVTARWSVAASADNDYSRIDESYSINNEGYSANGVAELKGSDDAWGYRIATLFKINDQNQIGLMYTSRINHDYSGKIAINGMFPPVYSNYGFNTPDFIANIQEKSVLPQTVRMGYSYKPTSKWTIDCDIEWFDWSSSKYEIPVYSGVTAQQLALLGNPVPLDWHSVWSETVGTQYAVTDRFRARIGFFHHGRVNPDATFNPVLPDSNSNGYTTGFGFDVTQRLTLDVAYAALYYNTRDIINTISNAAGGNIDGKYSQFVNIGMVSLTYKF